MKSGLIDAVQGAALLGLKQKRSFLKLALREGFERIRLSRRVKYHFREKEVLEYRRNQATALKGARK